jgi:hypothetical protein
MVPATPTLGLDPTTIAPTPQPLYFTREAALYRLRIWTAREWASIPARDRPRADYFPGLGWVGGEFVAALS